MRLLTRCLMVVGLLLFVSSARAQAPAQPGPEHEKLKQFVGSWDAEMDFGGQKSKGSIDYSMELGGLWLSSKFTGAIEGSEFSGHGMDGYDPQEKKYVGVWFDSMTATHMVSKGTFDDSGKVLTMVGTSTGPDGSPVEFTSVTKIVNKDKIEFTMSMPGPDGNPMQILKITYTRKK